jgi:hypothetical protein
MADFDYDSKLELRTELSQGECLARFEAGSNKTGSPVKTLIEHKAEGIYFQAWRSQPLSRLRAGPVFYGRIKADGRLTTVSGSFKVYPLVRIPGIILMVFGTLLILAALLARFFAKGDIANWLLIGAPVGIAISLPLRFLFNGGIVAGKRDIGYLGNFLQETLRAMPPAADR